MDEVEAQPIGCDERACLLDVCAEHLAERGMEKVRGRVVAACGVPAFGIDVGRDAVASLKMARGDGDSMEPWPARHFDQPANSRSTVHAVNETRVRDLASRFGVKRTLGEGE